MPEITFLLNDRRVTVAARTAGTALEVLRGLGLFGAREGCGEGDCGACTVALGQAGPGGTRYRAACSCILPAPRLHGCHVLTTEGLGTPESLHPVQQALVDAHAVQCGFCTPGIVMSLFCLFCADRAPGHEQVLAALEGNLCRCTGYEPMLAAAGSLARRFAADRAGLLPASAAIAPAILAGMPPLAGRAGWLEPRTREELRAALAENPGARFVAGGTDLVPAARGDEPGVPLVSLHRLEDARRIELDGSRLVIGAALPLADVAADPLVRDNFPALAETIGRMASAQVRNVATLGGNVANASPVADAAVTLLALDATLRLLSAGGERRVRLEDFYTGFRRTALGPAEVIAAIELPAAGYRASFGKTGKRPAVDIASANSALAVRVEGGVVTDCRFAVGGCAPFPLLCPAAAEPVIGRAPSPGIAEPAAEAAAGEAAPISDARGSAGFRRALVRGQFLAAWRRLFGGEP